MFHLKSKLPIEFNEIKGSLKLNSAGVKAQYVSSVSVFSTRSCQGRINHPILRWKPWNGIKVEVLHTVLNRVRVVSL